MATDFEEGMLVGLLIGEGHFGGDGRQPHVTLRMHERHEALFRWIDRTHPGGRLYGPYEHGGRRYYQWMARGAYLRDELVPMLRRTLSPPLDRYAYARFMAMCERYARQLGDPDRAPGEDAGAARAGEPAGAVRRENLEGTPDVGPADEALRSQAARIFAALRDVEASPDVGA